MCTLSLGYLSFLIIQTVGASFQEDEAKRAVVANKVYNSITCAFAFYCSFLVGCSIVAM